jgi:hypothetical protein
MRLAAIALASEQAESLLSFLEKGMSIRSAVASSTNSRSRGLAAPNEAAVRERQSQVGNVGLEIIHEQASALGASARLRASSFAPA